MRVSDDPADAPVAQAAPISKAVKDVFKTLAAEIVNKKFDDPRERTALMKRMYDLTP